MSFALDTFVSPTLKHLREEWWDAEFTEFLAETLRPRAGNRILDVGCGEGLAEVSIGRLQISQIRLAGVDLVPSKLVEARQTLAGHNLRAWFAAGDACRLPFATGAFDSLFCVAVLQHVRDVDAAVREMARVTRPGGRVVAVEPDNSARCGYSGSPAGCAAFEAARRFFAACDAGTGHADPAVGPKLPGIFVRHSLEPVQVRLFPVSHVILGPPDETVWEGRRAAIARAIMQAPGDDARAAGREYLRAIEAYAEDARTSGAGFVEIQNTMLFATVGQRIG